MPTKAKKTTPAKIAKKAIDPKSINVPNICFSIMSDNDIRQKEAKQQRITRGFDDSETWSLSDTIGNFIIPRLERFMEIHRETVVENPDWKKKTAAFLKAMKLAVRDRGSRMFSKKEEKELEQGLKAFSEIFMGLWW